MSVENLETDGSGKTVVDKIREAGPEWDVLAVDLADRSGDVLFLLVIRRRLNDSGQLILSERYFRFDLTEHEGSYTSNGIERRVVGSMGAALRVLYAASTNGDCDPEDPMLMDSSTDGIQYHPDELTEPLGFEEPETSDPDPGARAQPKAEGVVLCRRCGETLPERDAVKFGKGDLGDFWIHDGGCPDPEGDQ